MTFVLQNVNGNSNYSRFFAFIAFIQFCSWLLMLRISFDVSQDTRCETSIIKIQESPDGLPICSPSTLSHRNVSESVEKLADFTASEEFALMSKLIDAGLSFGGKSRYAHCRPLHNVAIIVPYRNRRNQRNIFVRYMHSFLQKQLVAYTIFIIEQADELPFNRGALINVGFAEASSYINPPFDCFIFHDVDLLPENERHIYSCPKEGKPNQLAYAVDIYDYEPIQRAYAGGVTAITAKDFTRINGFSNDYWGWGGEDDDFSRRLSHCNMTLVRSNDNDPSAIEYSKYRTLFHEPEKENPYRGNVFFNKVLPDDILTDGLDSLRYKRKIIKMKLYYTHVLVELQSKEVK